MPKIRCRSCQGSGRVMGGGMLMHDCQDCDGIGKLEEKIDHYQDAIQRIKALDPTMTNDQAKELFDKELSKIEKEDKNERGSKRKKTRSPA